MYRSHASTRAAFRTATRSGANFAFYIAGPLRHQPSRKVSFSIATVSRGNPRGSCRIR
jgi:hypothetical protein